MGRDRRLMRRIRAVGDWQLWSLPRWLAVFVLTVVAVYVAAIGVAASFTSFTPHELLVFGVLVACTAIAVELARKTGEPGHTAQDVQGVWDFPIAILLPPLFALLAPISRIALQQWRVRRAPPHRRVFTTASLGLSYCAASVAFHGLSAVLPVGVPGTLDRELLWTMLVIFSALISAVMNKTIILTAVKATGPPVNLGAEFFGGEALYNDVAELCIAVLVTYGVAAGNLFLAPAALPVVTLLQRSLRHAQLVTDSRADQKTGLLNATTWERESATEVARAVRTGSPLSVALLDIDKFKVINDTYGHLVGDLVLKEIAKTLNSVLRDYDRAGRFGGEEFSVLLPQTRAVDAFRIAERLRANIAGLNIIVPGTTGGERVHVTVSIGVAALDAGSKRELSELMAAADAALYRAKDGGRDQVQMISTTRGLSATSGPGTDTAEDRGADERPDTPSAFRRAEGS
jgi:diguanylate cyclase (GGDEF)-like protein